MCASLAIRPAKAGRTGRSLPVSLEASPAPRNPVARALAARSASGGAGRHLRSQGAQRRAERMQLQRNLHQINE
ncbi:hypothetical protein [Comamonas composti]|uniref:hypothetical protein n=1 Tax=Comamonas composti TaxID=408558 RepID=UPI00055849AF|nr:hypothetical protein [Comamonas composti]